MTDYIIDKLKERTTGKVLYPETLLESIKESDNSNSKNLRELLQSNGIPLDYELYGFKVSLINSDPQTRVSYFAMAEGKRPAFWDYTNGYFCPGDWSHAFFMRDCFPCMVKDDGTMDYKLDPDDYNLKEDGTSSDVANPEYQGSAMVAFPTIWLKRWQDENYLYCLISNVQLDKDFHAYMHTRADGTIAKYKYIAMYFSSLYEERYKSIAGAVTDISKTFENQFLYTKNIGDNWEMFSISDWATINDIVTLISKSDNSQRSFGYQLSNQAANTNTDLGTSRYGGAFYNSAALNTNSYNKMFHIIQLYGQYYVRLCGAIYNQGVLYIKPTPPYNTTGEDYINLELTISGTTNTCIKESIMNEYGRFPKTLGGTDSTYECDAVKYSNTILSIPCTRNVYDAKLLGGKMALALDLTSIAYAYVASRLTCFSVDSIDSSETTTPENEENTEDTEQ